MPAAGVLSAVALHILTFNIWGLPDAGFRVLSPFRAERVSAICSALRGAAARPEGWDAVLIQEAWTPEDRQSLKQCGYSYSVDLDDPARPLDAGLLILSKYPLDHAARLTYAVGGDPSRVAIDGEALARKSAIIARMDHPRAGHVWIADTHLVSIYDPANDTYAETRRAQLVEYASWARDQAGSEPLVIGGDFNSGPGAPLWNEAPRILMGFAQAPEADSSCTICPPNVMHSRNEGMIDHLFGSLASDPPLQPQGGRIAMDQPIGAPVSMNLSDHFAWETTFVVGAQR